MPEFGFDDWVDDQLRRVPLPPELLDRLRQDGARSRWKPFPTNGSICSVRSVPVPSYLELRLRRIARQPRPLARWVNLGLAASLLVVSGTLAFVLTRNARRRRRSGRHRSSCRCAREASRRRAEGRLEDGGRPCSS